MTDSESRLWEKLASEFNEGLREDLGAVRTRGAMQARGATRTRGGAREGAQPAGEPSEPAPVVVVEVPEDGDIPAEDEIRSKLSAPALDLYYVVRGRHWAALGERELNPDDADRGREHQLILRNLRPDFLLAPSGRARPSWCGEGTQMIE